MAEQLKAHVMRQQAIYLFGLVATALCLGVSVSLWFAWSANAAITEAVGSPVDYATASMVTKVRASSTIPVIAFKLTSSSPAGFFTQLNFTVSSTSGTTSGDFSNAQLFKDSNNNDIFDILGDTIIGVSTTVAVGATTTIIIDTDFGAGGNQAELVSSTEAGNWNYVLVLKVSSTATNLDSFFVRLLPTAETYILDSGSVTSNGVTTTAIVVDTIAPVTTTVGGPPNGQAGVPVDAMIDRRFNESLSPASVTTTAVILQTNTGNTQGGAPTGANLCAATQLMNNVQVVCDHMSDGSPLATSTWYTFTLSSSIADIAGNTSTASSTYVFQTGAITPGSIMTPPMVISSAPQPGSFDFPINGNLFVEFPQGEQGNMATSGPGMVSSTTNILLQLASNGAPSGGNLCASEGCALSWDVVQRKLKINPAADLTASTNYILTVKKDVKNVSGAALNNGMMDYITSFKTSGAADSTAPTSTVIYPTHGATGVQRNLPAITINFTKSLDDSTITTNTLQLFTDANTNGALDAGELVTSTVGDGSTSSTIRYDGYQKSVIIGLKFLLGQNTKYCIKMTGGGSGIKDISGNAMSAATVKCFTTVNAAFTATAPTVSFVDADSSRVWIKFSQPVDQTTALTKTNYTLENETSNSTINTTNATFMYQPDQSAVEIRGLALTTDSNLKVSVINVKDSSLGATIVENGTTNVGKTKVIAAGGNFASTQPEFSQTNFATFGISPKRCSPASLTPGKTTRLMCEFPVPAALATGAKIILTAPTGSSVNTTTALSAANSPMNADLNGPGPGVTTISGVATNTIANTIELTLNHSGTAMGSTDMLRFELDGFVNPDAGQKSFSIIVKDASGYKQGETIYPAPFTIAAGGSLSLGGKVCKGTTSGGACGGGDTGVEGVKVMLQSMGSNGSGSMGGTEIATTDSSGDYSFTGLSLGQYMINMFIDPASGGTLGTAATNQMVNLSASVSNIHFKLTDLSSTGKLFTATIAGGPASTAFDLFCFAPGNVSFSAPVMKKGTTDGAGAASVTMRLQPNTNYECGVGPSIPFSSMTSGGPPPVPDFTFIPPKPQTIIVANVDVSATFTLTVATQKIIGKVQDSSGTGIGNVFVQASPTGCFDASTGASKECRSSFAQTKTDGTFSVNVTVGTYGLMACMPGMPCSAPTEATVKANTGAVDNNSNADVYVNGTLVTSASGITIKMAKSDLTIAGQVQDENGSAIKYAFVNAQKAATGATCSSFTPEGGFTGSPSDSSGNFTLYVSAGTWVVRAHAPAYGEVACSVITLTSSASGQNLKATAADYGTITGTVTKNSSAVQGANINCYGSAGGNFAVTGADGTYSMKVKSGTYTCDGYIPGAGPLGLQTGVVVTSGGSVTADLSMGNPGTITITTGVTDAFCDARTSAGRGAGSGQNNAGVYTISVPAGTYTVRCGNPKIGSIGSQSVTVTAGGSHSVTFTAPTTFTVSGAVTDGSNNLEGAFVTFIDKTNGRVANIQSTAVSSGNNVSIALPAGTYAVSASKSGYVDVTAVQTLTLTANTTITTRAMTKAAAAVSVTVQASSANYTGSSRIIATKSDGQVVVVSTDKAVTSGANATLNLTNGSWSVKAMGDNGKQSDASTVTVSSDTPSPSTLTLDLANSISGFTAAEANQQSITPSTGGLITDTEISNGASSLQVSIPSGALSTSDSSAGSIETKCDPTLAVNAPGVTFIGKCAPSITPKSADGNTLSTLSEDATLVIPYVKADVTSAGATESKLTCGVWSEASNSWETLPTTVDTTNNTLTCQTSHFSTFGVVAGNSGGTTSSSSSSSSSSSGSGATSNNPPVLPKASIDETKNAVTINAGAKETNSRNVTLTLNATNASEMAISNDAGFTGASFVPFKSSVSWVLSEGNGVKTVYVKFRSKDTGTADASDTIMLTGQASEQAKPVVTPKGPAESASPVAKFVFSRNMDMKARAAEVKELQKQLRALKFFSYPTDTGIYGSVTIKAVRAFQKANGLKQTGLIDAATLAKLNDGMGVEEPIKVSAPTASKSSGFMFKNTLNSQSRGAEVQALQKRLRELGYFTYSTDTGTYGSATAKAVRAFQKANGIAQTGSVGPQTRAALNQ